MSRPHARTTQPIPWRLRKSPPFGGPRHLAGPRGPLPIAGVTPGGDLCVRYAQATKTIRRMSESSQSVWITDGGGSTTLERSVAAASACASRSPSCRWALCFLSWGMWMWSGVRVVRADASCAPRGGSAQRWSALAACDQGWCWPLAMAPQCRDARERRGVTDRPRSRAASGARRLSRPPSLRIAQCC